MSDSPKLATVKEVADLYRVSPRTVYRWIREEVVQVKQVAEGRAVRVVIMEEARASSQ
jgi:excisionase family DNA binding protein